MAGQGPAGKARRGEAGRGLAGGVRQGSAGHGSVW